MIALLALASVGWTQEAKPSCDASLWRFVHNPSRLSTKDDCRAVVGTIKDFKPEPDGDYHIRFIPDDKTLVNGKNNNEQGGALVAEPICQNTPTRRDAIQACQGYSGPKFSMGQFCPGAPKNTRAPAKGKGGRTYTCKNPPRVQITGFYTIDSGRGWMELHPVSKIELVH